MELRSHLRCFEREFRLRTLSCQHAFMPPLSMLAGIQWDASFFEALHNIVKFIRFYPMSLIKDRSRCQLKTCWHDRVLNRNSRSEIPVVTGKHYAMALPKKIMNDVARYKFDLMSIWHNPPLELQALDKLVRILLLRPTRQSMQDARSLNR
jgi:hypothetical protein